MVRQNKVVFNHWGEYFQVWFPHFCSIARFSGIGNIFQWGPGVWKISPISNPFISNSSHLHRPGRLYIWPLLTDLRIKFWSTKLSTLCASARIPPHTPPFHSAFQPETPPKGNYICSENCKNLPYLHKGLFKLDRKSQAGRFQILFHWGESNCEWNP